MLFQSFLVTAPFLFVIKFDYQTIICYILLRFFYRKVCCMMKTRDLTGCALSAALIAICSWISIPAALPFTMQTFAIFLTAGIFGGKKAFLSMLLYLLLGMIGLPVFAGFKGGIGVIL